MIWQEKRVVLIILGLLLVANTIFFFTYRVQYQSRLDALDERLAEAEKELQQARTTRVRAEQTWRSYKKVETDVQKIYDELWSTQTERLTPMISEVKRLTTASSLVPTTITFTEVSVEVKPAATATNARRRRQQIGANEVGIGFGVDGTYEQVRRLINLLELSRQFVIIDQIGLVAREGQVLSFNLHLKTLFRDEKPGVANNNRL